MKKFFLMMVLGVLGMPQSVAQEYVPFVREGVKWVCEQKRYSYPFTDIIVNLELKGDVQINGKTYKAMHKYCGDAINPSNDTVLVYLREEDKVVYGIVPNGVLYPEYPIGIVSDQEMKAKIASGEEFVLYDFNDFGRFMDSHDKIWPYHWQRRFIPDRITVAGKQVNRYVFGWQHNLCLVEGIGYDGLGEASPLSLLTGSFRLSRVVENGEVIYTSERFKTKAPSDGFLPIEREGVQWINEKVVVDHGNITVSYYTYEFSGTVFRDYPACYLYTGKNMTESTDATFIGSFSTPYELTGIELASYCCDDCEPFVDNMQSGRSMMYYYGYTTAWPIYRFSNNESDIDYSNPINHYIYNQNDEFLSHGNIVKAEPLIIEGVICDRYAYLDEEGNPLAYVVEGIGFDSYDMGDLLTPFTCKPDPDADYQEYCGLSHVIKDGEIIYKGMRFDPDKVYGIPGDMNGDGTLTIDDLTLLIDYLLTDKPRYSYTGDVTGNGSVGIDDVTALIDLLLRAD